MFGGGRGSGGGAENTDITECMQCVYCSEIFNGVKRRARIRAAFQ